jgi:tripartite-type tricarboxylate transporter receptor subunit TctC
MDTLVRLIAPAVSQELGQPLVVDNKPGANGLIGVRALMRAEPDGYTVLFATVSILAINPFIYKNIPYDTLRDLKPVARHAMFPFIIASYAPRGFKNLGDVAAYSRAHPDDLKLGHPGIGSFGHLLEESFLRKQGLTGLLVPFSSAPQANTGAAGGVVDVVVDNASSLASLVTDGRLTPLAVTTAERSPVYPDVPSWLEDGTGPFAASAWYAFLAPAKTPDAVVQKLNAAINRALMLPEVQERIRMLGGTFTPQSPEELATFIGSELDKYRAVVREIGVKPE